MLELFTKVGYKVSFLRTEELSRYLDCIKPVFSKSPVIYCNLWRKMFVIKYLVLSVH